MLLHSVYMYDVSSVMMLVALWYMLWCYWISILIDADAHIFDLFSAGEDCGYLSQRHFESNWWQAGVEFSLSRTSSWWPGSVQNWSDDCEMLGETDQHHPVTDQFGKRESCPASGYDLQLQRKMQSPDSKCKIMFLQGKSIAYNMPY